MTMKKLPPVVQFVPADEIVKRAEAEAAEARRSSSSPKGMGSEEEGKIPGLIRLCEAVEPPPVEFFWGTYIPIGYLTSIFANGGTGKSLLVVALSFAVCEGRPFLDLNTRRADVLWIDAEGMGDENLRRFFKVSRGLGLRGAMPEGLYHYELDGPITDPKNMDKVSRVIQKMRDENGKAHPLLIILDSFTAASFNTDQVAASEVTSVLKILATYGTVAIVDHISKAAATAGKAGTAFGSIFKRNFVRSQLELCSTDDGACSITHEKANLSRKSDPIFYAHEFSDQAITFCRIGADDPRLIGLSGEVNTVDTVRRFLVDEGEPFRAAAIAKELGISEGTIRNALSKLKENGKVDQPSRGLWRAKPSAGWSSSSLHDSIREEEEK